MAAIDIFERSNTTIQNDTSRASSYYAVSKPYRYHISEIANPNISSDFFNVGYKGRIFAKIKMVLNGNNYDLIRYDEELNYATDKTGVEEYKVMKYCKIKELVMLDGEGQPILDEDDYVIIT